MWGAVIGDIAGSRFEGSRGGAKDSELFHRDCMYTDDTVCTAAVAEIDLLIEHDDGTRWAIEIKRSLSARVGRGFHLACADLEPARAFVVHAGDDRYPMSETLEAVSVRGLAAELRARS